MIWTLKVACLGGPYHDGQKCVRYIELDEESSLYDVHTAIQEAMHFDDEFEFAFFLAKAPNVKRVYYPEGVNPDDGVDGDLYEDVPFADATAEKGQKLFYVFNFDEEWVFSVEREKGSKKPRAGEIYPLVLVDRNEGPDPMQYDNGEDDFATHEEASDYRASRRFRATDDDDGGDFDDDDDGFDDDSDDFDDDDDDDFDDDDDDCEEDDEEGYEDERDDQW